MEPPLRCRAGCAGHRRCASAGRQAAAIHAARAAERTRRRLQRRSFVADRRDRRGLPLRRQGREGGRHGTGPPLRAHDVRGIIERRAGRFHGEDQGRRRRFAELGRDERRSDLLLRDRAEDATRDGAVARGGSDARALQGDGLDTPGRRTLGDQERATVESRERPVRLGQRDHSRHPVRNRTSVPRRSRSDG